MAWMARRIAARGFGVHYLALPAAGEAGGKFKPRTAPIVIHQGDCPLDNREFATLIERVELQAESEPIVQQYAPLGADSDSAMYQMIIAPIGDGDRLFGCVAAFKRLDDRPFRAEDKRLVRRVATLLGIHSGNRERQRQQSDLLANVIRALVSAIDAKDPYTCGHSDRVTRFAVRIALQMRVGPRLLNTIYLAGLLHDVGKIGINDGVLRKTERLTEAEYEHVKIHPEMGHRILADLKPLADVLPAVLHHHEQWNGGGYPHRLAGTQIPMIARILAVADAYDAMTSDRPYRKGMDTEKVEAILREGAGKQWDPDVINAYLRVKEDVEHIARWDRAPPGHRAGWL